MKKQLLSAALILGGLTAFAQITVEKSSYAVPGDWFLIANDTTIDESTSSALKLAGQNKRWDLSGWADRHSKDTTFYADGFTYPGAPAGCNLVSYEKDPFTMEEMPTYYNISNTALRVILEAGPTSGAGGAFKLFQFPSTMGTKFTDSTVNFLTLLASDFGLELPFVDSLRITYTFKVTSEVDAYGKLKLDAGEFDVIRQLSNTNVRVKFMVRNTITGTYSSLPGFGDANENINSYAWLSANGGHPLLIANTDTTGLVTDIEYVLASSRGLSSGLNQVSSAISMNVYPNPAKENTHIELNTIYRTPATLSMLDVLGNEVLVQENVSLNAGYNSIPLNLNGIKPGVYFIQLVQGDIKTSKRFVVEN